MPRQNSYMIYPSTSWLSMIVASICGLSTLFLTMSLFYISHPEYFQKGLPSISRAAAFEPSRDVFAVGMCVASFFGVITWLIVLRSNRSAYRTQDRTGRTIVWFTAVFGIAASILLVLLAIVNSNWNGPLHELFSILFFFVMIITYILDAAWLLRARRYNGFNPPKHVHRLGSQKLGLTGLLVGLGIVMFTFYLLDKSNFFINDRTIKTVFGFLEYLVGALCFLIPVTQYREQTAFWYALSEEGSRSSAEQ
jgi:hypothetical protein